MRTSQSLKINPLLKINPEIESAILKIIENPVSCVVILMILPLNLFFFSFEMVLIIY